MVLRVYGQLAFFFNLEILVAVTGCMSAGTCSITGCMSAGMCSITEIYQYIFTLKVQDVGKSS